MNEFLIGDVLDKLSTLPTESIDCVITSPPYWGLRDYGIEGQLGLEKTPEEYVAKMVEVFREVRRVLKKEGTLWLNLGDSYNSTPIGRQVDPKRLSANGEYSYDFKKPFWDKLPAKNLIGIPWRVAFALQTDGWYLRQDIIWAKPNPMPESVTDRCTKSHEYIFLLAKSSKYYFDNKAIKEPAHFPNEGKWSQGSNKGYKDNQDFPARKLHEYVSGENRNKRSVWAVTTKPFKDAHFATFPEDLITPMILAGCPKDGIVLDPFIGSGTTAVVAQRLGRRWLGIDLKKEYIEMAEKRLSGVTLPLL